MGKFRNWLIAFDGKDAPFYRAACYTAILWALYYVFGVAMLGLPPIWL